jgi:hypothetical protein
MSSRKYSTIFLADKTFQCLKEYLKRVQENEINKLKIKNESRL